MKQLSATVATAVPMSEASTIHYGNRDNTASTHLGAGCECRTIDAPSDDIARILGNGQVPILTIDTTATDKLGLHAKRCNRNTEYVVVWHTIPDGLGSAVHNTIPTCQLIRIADRLGKLLVEEIRSELGFWLGTLCIPAALEYQRLRETARQLIDDIYEQAYAILVVDPQWLRTEADTPVNDQLRSYQASLMRANSRLALNSRILVMTTPGFIDLLIEDGRAGDSIPLTA